MDAVVGIAVGKILLLVNKLYALDIDSQQSSKKSWHISLVRMSYTNIIHCAEEARSTE